MSASIALEGVGLGLRRGFIQALCEAMPDEIAFLELAPENWIHIGGRFSRQFEQLAERYPLVCHGLSLSIGGPDPLDLEFLAEVKGFLDRYRVRAYSEHLSYCAAGGHLYDLLPLPHTEEAVRHAAGRIRKVQEFLERPLIIENVSTYLQVGTSMSEAEFVAAVVAEANCALLLDVNNVFVNAHNHGFDAEAYIAAMPTDRIAYLHMAGHFDHSLTLKIDTHGAPVSDPVWQLLDYTYHQHGVFATLLERDFNFPPLDQLLGEMAQIAELQQPYRDRAGLAMSGMGLNPAVGGHYDGH